MNGTASRIARLPIVVEFNGRIFDPQLPSITDMIGRRMLFFQLIQSHLSIFFAPDGESIAKKLTPFFFKKRFVRGLSYGVIGVFQNRRLEREYKNDSRIKERIVGP